MRIGTSKVSELDCGFLNWNLDWNGIQFKLELLYFGLDMRYFGLEFGYVLIDWICY